MGKGEISRYEQFLLFPHVFNRHVLQTRKNQWLFEKGLNLKILCCGYYLDIPRQQTSEEHNLCRTFVEEEVFEKKKWKAENAGYKHFPLSSNVLQILIHVFQSHLVFSLQILQFRLS